MFSKIKKAITAFKNELSGTKSEANEHWYSVFDEWRTRDGNVLHEAVYYTCLRILSESIGKMPIKLFCETPKGKEKAQNGAYIILKTRPNPYLTPSQFMTSLMLNSKHYGNGYAYIRKKRIKRQAGYGFDEKIIDMWIMPSNQVTVVIDDNGVFGKDKAMYYQYADTDGEQYVFGQDEVLHIKNSFSFNGYLGKSVIEMLGEIVEGNLSGQEFVKKLNDEGLTAKLSLSFSSDLNDKQIDALTAAIKKHIKNIEDATTIVPVPPGMNLSPLSYKLTDAQFMELRKYTSLQIAAAFGIKPDQLNDYSKSSYSSSEAQQLSFLVDTLLYDIKNLEEELNYKLLTPQEREQGYFFKLNEKAILRIDSETQSRILTSYVNNGIYTIDEARDILDYVSVEGGNKSIVNGNYIPLTMVGEQYAPSGGDKIEE